MSKILKHYDMKFNFAFKTPKKTTYREMTMEDAMALARQRTAYPNETDYIELMVKSPKTAKYIKLGTYYPFRPGDKNYYSKDEERRNLVVPVV